MTSSTTRPRSNKPLIALLLIALAPLVLALLAYYVPGLGLRPQSHMPYGQLIEPQRPIPESLALQDRQGQPYDLTQLRSQWLLINTGPGLCPEPCVRGLYVLRNSHASQGKNVDRLQRILFVTDQDPIAPVLDEAYQGTIVLRADKTALAQWLVPDSPDPDTALQDGLWIVDPLGHLMIQFPDASEPEAVRDVIRTLLKNSRIG